jgi:hypothetical protein
MSRVSYSGLAVVGAAVLIVLFSWLDTTVVADAIRGVSAGFDGGPVSFVISLVGVGLAASILGLAVTAWRSRSGIVGSLYAMVGVLLAFLPVIFFSLAAGRNGSPPVLPDPMARLIGDLVRGTSGPTNAVSLLGASMLVVGLAVLTRAAREPAPPSTDADEPNSLSDAAEKH